MKTLRRRRDQGDVEDIDVYFQLLLQANAESDEKKRNKLLEIADQPRLLEFLAARARRRGLNAERDWDGFGEAMKKLLDALMPLILKLLELLVGLVGV